MTTQPVDLTMIANIGDALADTIRGDASRLEALTEDLRALAAEFPVVVPPAPAPLVPDVRAVFDHGGEWSTRTGWQIALNRAPMRRSMWTVASSPAAQLAWVASFVADVMADDGKTVYVVGVSPFPGSVYEPGVLAQHYDACAAQLSRLGLAQRARVFLRFGWEPNGDWYPHSFAPPGGAVDPARIDAYVRAWNRWPRVAGISMVLNFAGEGAAKDPALFQRVAVAVAPNVVSVDVYPMWGTRSWAAHKNVLDVCRGVSRSLGLPWAVDEWSPYVDKVTQGIQRGAQDTKVGLDVMRGMHNYAQQATLDGDKPLWIQMFERVIPEGKFSAVSVANPTQTASTVYRTAGGALRYSYAPRIAAMVVALLGNPA